tara:strand:- start:55 stop:531 length:477 start_codon:yes stop_codon:yes gene_type:complete
LTFVFLEKIRKTNSTMFLKEHGTAALLLAAVFLGLGFMLGKVTSCHGSHRGCDRQSECSHSSKSKCNHSGAYSDSGAHAGCSHSAVESFSGGEHMIIVESMIESGFEGDTVLTIPGGEIHMSIHGDDVDVRVEIEEHDVHDEQTKEVKVVKVITVNKD